MASDYPAVRFCPALANPVTASGSSNTDRCRSPDRSSPVHTTLHWLSPLPPTSKQPVLRPVVKGRISHSVTLFDAQLTVFQIAVQVFPVVRHIVHGFAYIAFRGQLGLRLVLPLLELQQQRRSFFLPQLTSGLGRQPSGLLLDRIQFLDSA